MASLGTAEMTGRAKFSAPVLHKARISVIDDKGKTLTRADQAKERIGCGDRGHMDWDEINNIAIKKNVAKISYPMLNTILAPQPCFPAELACATIVGEKLLKCEVRNNINLKTLLGSATGSFFAQDSQGIDEKELTHLRHLVRGFGVYTGSRSILFIDDVKQIPKQGFDMTTAEKTPKEVPTATSGRRFSVEKNCWIQQCLKTILKRKTGKGHLVTWLATQYTIRM